MNPDALMMRNSNGEPHLAQMRTALQQEAQRRGVLGEAAQVQQLSGLANQAQTMMNAASTQQLRAEQLLTSTVEGLQNLVPGAAEEKRKLQQMDPERLRALLS